MSKDPKFFAKKRTKAGIYITTKRCMTILWEPVLHIKTQRETDNKKKERAAWQRDSQIRLSGSINGSCH